MPKIIVGAGPADRRDDALSLATVLARRTGAELVLVRAYPFDDAPGHVSDSVRRHRLRERAQEALDRTRAEADGALRITTRTIADPSPARALHTLAERERASLIVIGSSHRGAVGSVFAGTTAESLLQGAPCAVAIAPKGFGDADRDAIARVTVGWDRSGASTTALEAATAIARALAADLRIVEVLDMRWAGTPAIVGWRGAGDGGPDSRARAQLDEVVASVPGDVPVEAAVMLGDPVGELATLSEDADLLVLGSRGYGPRRAVLLGSVSRRVIRRAACPVLVIPRGTAASIEDLFRRVRRAERPSPAHGAAR